jgi:hypothetical protein
MHLEAVVARGALMLSLITSALKGLALLVVSGLAAVGLAAITVKVGEVDGKSWWSREQLELLAVYGRLAWSETKNAVETLTWGLASFGLVVALGRLKTIAKLINDFYSWCSLSDSSRAASEILTFTLTSSTLDTRPTCEMPSRVPARLRRAKRRCLASPSRTPSPTSFDRSGPTHRWADVCRLNALKAI